MTWQVVQELPNGTLVECCDHEEEPDTTMTTEVWYQCPTCGSSWRGDVEPVPAIRYRATDGPPLDDEIREASIGFFRPAPNPRNEFALFRSLFAGPPTA